MSSPYLASILLACGCSKRFGSNKLLAPFRGQPLCERVFQRHPMELFQQNLVVTRYPQAAIFASQQGFSVVEVFDGAEDVAQTIRLGLQAVDSRAAGCLFAVCDQPLLRPESIQKLVAAFLAHPQAVVALGWQGRRGNPVCFPRLLFGELAQLPAQHGGSWVVNAHPERLLVVEAAGPEELEDVDRPEDLARLEARP